ncbi:hypothetical protein Zmor_016838 [Zophobas morio]|uniref:Uncharacterized protein n=1 Tax=Zophobas morio TaxID=2755281 RepID=A0AA38I4A3_9CUCU|nr:hypothetical protein Zmor_016838 [Zophobas morio]
MEYSTVRFVAKDGVKKTPTDLEDVKAQIARIDGTTIKIPSDRSYVDITIPEGNYYLIRLLVCGSEQDAEELAQGFHLSGAQTVSVSLESFKVASFH